VAKRKVRQNTRHKKVEAKEKAIIAVIVHAKSKEKK
jgi:hypothetical protein